MNPSICRCCGKRISERGGFFSRNPNVCAACLSLLEELEEASALRQKDFVFADAPDLGPMEREAA